MAWLLAAWLFIMIVCLAVQRQRLLRKANALLDDIDKADETRRIYRDANENLRLANDRHSTEHERDHHRLTRLYKELEKTQKELNLAISELEARRLELHQRRQEVRDAHAVQAKQDKRFEELAEDYTEAMLKIGELRHDMLAADGLAAQLRDYLNPTRPADFGAVAVRTGAHDCQTHTGFSLVDNPGDNPGAPATLPLFPAEEGESGELLPTARREAAA